MVVALSQGRVRARALARCALAAALAACEAAPAVARAPAMRPAAPLMRADTATIDFPRAYAGQVYVEHDVAVAARAPGALDSLYVNLGSTVKAGQLLAVVERRTQQIAVASAHERLERARGALTRARLLATSGSVTGVDSEQIAGEFRQAELTVDRAEHDLVLTRVTAPFDGVVTARYAHPRQLVAAGDTLFRVAESSPQLVRIRVGESAARSVARGDTATVRASLGAATARAAVVLVSPALDPGSGTREVILRIAGVPFLVGQNVAVDVGSERRTVVVVPRAAVAPDGWVLVVDGSRTMLRPVTIGADVGGGRVEVVSGLAAGERLAPPRR
jgi:RND family efflux transporter MFP subunit